ncbi:sarcosine oxidase [Fusarium proliferatum]|nr:sarcosine oxidase [Fusarium proliferatum]KAG4276439.1 sarcosine oxidase [Fusarium proliferatum]KAG4290763.1 sarcosine oxidase [Fusarium proliferatum]
MTLQFRARFNGAVLMENTRVEAVMPHPGGGVTIETSQGVYHARKVIIAADAWTNKLLKPLGIELPITVMREQVTYFKPSREHEAQFANDKFPVRIWGGEKWFYGFPLYGLPALKAGQDAGRNDMDSEDLYHQRVREKHKGVILALGNAHAFKFAPAVGRLTAELALDGKTTDDISKFGFPNTTPSKL